MASSTSEYLQIENFIKLPQKKHSHGLSYWLSHVTPDPKQTPRSRPANFAQRLLLALGHVARGGNVGLAGLRSGSVRVALGVSGGVGMSPKE